MSGMPVTRLNRTAVIEYVGRPPNQNCYENVEFWRISYSAQDRYAFYGSSSDGILTLFVLSTVGRTL